MISFFHLLIVLSSSIKFNIMYVLNVFQTKNFATDFIVLPGLYLVPIKKAYQPLCHFNIVTYVVCKYQRIAWPSFRKVPVEIDVNRYLHKFQIRSYWIYLFTDRLWGEFFLFRCLKI